MKEISKTKFLELYEKGQVRETVVFDNKIYGLTNNENTGTKGFIVIWATL